MLLVKLCTTFETAAVCATFIPVNATNAVLCPTTFSCGTVPVTKFETPAYMVPLLVTVMELDEPWSTPKSKFVTVAVMDAVAAYNDSPLTVVDLKLFPREVIDELPVMEKANVVIALATKL